MTHEITSTAILKAGGQSAVAAALRPPCKPQAVQQWRRVPADHVIRLAELTGFTFTPHDLRPDLYPHPEDGLPAELRGRFA